MQVVNKKLILGTAQFGLNYGINNKTGIPDKSHVNEIFANAFDLGIRILDTAESYGNAHNVIGAFHKKNPNRRFKVITKLPHIINESFDKKINNYIQQFCVDKLYVLLFHSFDSYKRYNNFLPLLTSYKKQNIIQNLGVSVYTNEQLLEVINDDLIDVIQFPFNVFDNVMLRGKLLKEAKQRGKIIHTRSTFLQGLFFIDDEMKNPIAAKLRSELNYLRHLSAKYKLSLSAITLSYCLAQPEIDNVLIGIDNKTQLKQNIDDANIKLPESLLQKLNAIKIENIHLLNPSLWNRITQL